MEGFYVTSSGAYGGALFLEFYGCLIRIGNISSDSLARILWIYTETIIR